jgi:hypothetical protein
LIVGQFDEVYKNLKNTAISLGTFDVYKKEEIPDRWHMKNTTRLTGIIYLLAKPGYEFWSDYIQRILDKSSEFIQP